MTSSTRKTICFDLDGTLCTNTGGAYETAQPFGWAIERLNALARAGHRILVFTARGTATGIDWTEVTRSQLERWGVLYDELHLGKPSADIYVDDRAVHTTAWREGDAFAPPGFGLPSAANQSEPLPAVLASSRTTVVETGRTYGGSSFQADEHVERLRLAAKRAGIRDAPAAAELREALETALAPLVRHGSDLVFTIALAGSVSAAFLDLAGERSEGPAITVRPFQEVAEGLRPFVLNDLTGPVAIRASAHSPEGRLGAALNGRLTLAPEPDGAPPLSSFVIDLAREAGIDVTEELLDRDELQRAEGVFMAVVPFGLLRVGEHDGSPLDTDDSVRSALVTCFSERVGLDVDAQLADALRTPLATDRA